VWTTIFGSAVKNMEAQFQCPECKRPLASRRHKKCQYCGAELPESLLYTKSEIEALNREWEKSQAKRKADGKERDEEERKKQDDGGAAAAGMIGMM
jgi:hypothetical protein